MRLGLDVAVHVRVATHVLWMGPVYIGIDVPQDAKDRVSRCSEDGDECLSTSDMGLGASPHF